MLDDRVRGSDRNPPIPADFADSRGTPIVITADGNAWVLLSGNRVVKIGEGMSMEQEVATTGLYRGKAAKLVSVLGSRSLGWASTSAFGDAADYLDISQSSLNTVSVGTTYYLVSTSAQDAAGGTGVDTARITYLDANGLEQVVTKTLTGTTPVSLGTGFTAVQFMETQHATQPKRTAAGNITISSINGAATVATTVEKVSSGGNRSLSGRWKVPSDCVAYLIDWWAAAISATMDTRLRVTEYANGGASTAYHFIDRIFLASGQGANAERHYQKLLPGTEIVISAIPGSAPAGNKLDCSFDLICVQL